MKAVYCFIGMFFCSLTLHAELVMPPASRTQTELNAYLDLLTKDHAWIFSNNRMDRNNATTYIAKETELLRVLNLNQTFLKEAAKRPPLRNYKIRSYQKGIAQKYSLLKSQVKKLTLSLDEEDLKSLETEIVAHLDAMEQRPLNSILVGVLRSFPKDISQAGFKITDIAEKVTFIRKHLAKSEDSQIRQEFQGARYGLQGNAWGVKDVVGLIDKAEKSSQQLFEMAVQYLSSVRSQEGESSALVFDGEDQLTESLQQVLDDRLGRKTNWRLIHPELKLWMDQYFCVQQTEVPVVQYEVELEEIPPYVATYRGSITIDCSTTNSPYYPYSPFERNFIIKVNGNAVAHASGTIVEAEGKKVFYFHDLRGTVNSNYLNVVLLGILDNYPVLGVDGVVFLTDEKRGQITWGTNLIDQVASKTKIPLNYYAADSEIRSIIDKHVASAGYDGVAYNTHGYAPLKNPDRAGIGSTEIFITSDTGLVPGFGKQYATSLAVQQLGLLVGGNKLSGKVENLELLESAAVVLLNEKRLPLEKYYEAVAEALKEVGVKFSNKLFNDNPALFSTGHFRASDAYRSSDDVMDRRAFQLVYELIYQDIPAASEVIKKFPAEWLRRPKMKKLLSQFLEERGEQGIQRVNQLIENGVPIMGVLLEGKDSTAAVFAAKNRLLMYQAVKHLSEQGPMQLDTAMWNEVSDLLDNEDKSVDESWSLLASQLFAHADPIIDSEIVRQQLRASVKHEEDEQILLYASIAYIRYGILNHAEATESETRAYAKAAHLLSESKRLKEFTAAFWNETLASVDQDLVEAGDQIELQKKKKKQAKAKDLCAEEILDQAYPPVVRLAGGPINRP